MTARSVFAQATDRVVTCDTATATVITYPQRLLKSARKYIDEGDFQMATVVCHMACEIAVERALSAGFMARGIADLEESIGKLHIGYSLGNERLRDLYTALTKDEIQKEPFWAEYKVSCARRNAIIHRGATVTKQEAENSLAAASSLVVHLKQ